MSLTYQHLFAKSPSRIVTFCSSSNSALIIPTLRPITFRHLTKPLNSRNFGFHPQSLKTLSISNIFPPPKAYASDGAVQTRASGGADLDSLLLVVEFLCLSSAAVVAISYAANCTFSGSKRTVLGVIGSHGAFAWAMVVLVGGVAVGTWIRRRRWGLQRGSLPKGREGLDLVGRVEKLEEDLRSSAAIIRVLSRQLEKLGIRFRVTRKSFKEPIAETAALAQKNSEVTRALAVREDILEKELVEIQKVLLAMQEQQQKQLELILAIGKTGNLWETKPGPSQERDAIQSSDLNQEVNHLTHETHASRASTGANNDRP